MRKEIQIALKRASLPLFVLSFLYFIYTLSYESFTLPLQIFMFCLSIISLFYFLFGEALYSYSLLYKSKKGVFSPLENSFNEKTPYKTYEKYLRILIEYGAYEKVIRFFERNEAIYILFKEEAEKKIANAFLLMQIEHFKNNTTPFLYWNQLVLSQVPKDLELHTEAIYLKGTFLAKNQRIEDLSAFVNKLEQEQGKKNSSVYLFLRGLLNYERGLPVEARDLFLELLERKKQKPLFLFAHAHYYLFRLYGELQKLPSFRKQRENLRTYVKHLAPKNYYYRKLLEEADVFFRLQLTEGDLE